MNRHWLALTIATALVGNSVEAAVICEFEPTPDMADCSRCFKTSVDGSSLFLGGKRAASGTDAERFHQIRVGSVVYQRGVEKVAYSKRNGVLKLFEVCYERAPQVKASSIVLDMDPDAEIQEFELRVDRGEPSTKYDFALIRGPVPEEGAAGVFGNTLVFSPSSHWSGRTVLNYTVVGPDGRAATGSITIQRLQNQVAGQVVDAEVKALSEQLASLQNSLDSLQEQLSVETQLGANTLDQIKRMEEALAVGYRAVANLDRQIADIDAELQTRRKANDIARLEALMGVTFDHEVYKPTIGRAQARDLQEGPVFAQWEPIIAPVLSQSSPFLVPYFNSPVPFRRSFVHQPGGSLKTVRRRWPKFQRQDPPERRRLTKREKKAAKKARMKKAL